jgi:hypothetical protein
MRKRSGSGRRSWALNILIQRRASITWPGCTGTWASTRSRVAVRKPFGSGGRYSGKTILTPPRASITWPSCTRRWASTPKPNQLYEEALEIAQKVLGPEHPHTATSLENLGLLEFDLDRIDEAKALARQAATAELTILSKIFSFTSEQQRLAYLHIFRPYSLFPFIKGTETDLAAAVLRYIGVAEGSSLSISSVRLITLDFPQPNRETARCEQLPKR